MVPWIIFLMASDQPHRSKATVINTTAQYTKLLFIAFFADGS